MSRLSRRVQRNGTFVQGMAQRASLLLLMSISLGLLVIGKIEPRINEQVQRLVLDVAAPVTRAVGAPVVWIRQLIQGMEDITITAEQLEQMRLTNERLRQLQPLASQLATENERLRKLLGLGSITDTPSIPARAITHPGSPFLWTVLLDAGQSAGVKIYQPVVDSAGVVGRILKTGRRSSRALLVTDMNSRVPVLIKETGDRAILEGDNTRSPKLSFLDVAHSIKAGLHVVTSGDGGIYPPLLPVGMVGQDNGAEFRVILASDLSRLEYVQILKFEAVQLPVVPGSTDTSATVAPTDNTKSGLEP